MNLGTRPLFDCAWIFDNAPPLEEELLRTTGFAAALDFGKRSSMLRYAMQVQGLCLGSRARDLKLHVILPLPSGFAPHTTPAGRQQQSNFAS